MKLRALRYLRVSSDDQRDGTSIQTQDDRTAAFCRQRDWDIVATITEGGEGDEGRGRSAKSFAGRADWQRVIAMASARQFDVLVCDKIDRFSRASIRDALEQLDTLRANNVRFASATEPEMDFTSPIGELMFVFALWFARRYITDLSAKITSGKRGRIGLLPDGTRPANARPPRSNASIAPPGYVRAKGGALSPHPQFGPLVGEGLRQFAPRGWRTRDFHAWLTEHGLRRPNGVKYTMAAIYDLIRSRIPLGELNYRGLTDRTNAKGDRLPRNRGEMIWFRNPDGSPVHEPLITEDVWQRNQDAQSARTSGIGAKYTRNRVYLLSGLLRCAACGGALTAAFLNRTHMAYLCRANVRGVSCPDDGIYVRESLLMPFIEAEIASVTNLADVLDEAKRQSMNRATRETTRGKLAEIEREAKKVRALFMAEAISETEMQRLTADLNVRRERLRQAEAAVPMVGEAIEHLAEGWAAANAISDAQTRRRLQREIVHAIIASVAVDVRARTVKRIERHAEFTGA